MELQPVPKPIIGFVGGLYVLQSSGNSWLFGIGLVWENVIYLATLLLILTFPTGRVEGWAAKLILFVAIVAAAVPATLIVLVLPQVGAGASISGCKALCPENALAVTSQPSLALDLADIYRPAAIVVALATAGLLVWRLLPNHRSWIVLTGASLAWLAVSVLIWGIRKRV